MLDRRQFYIDGSWVDPKEGIDLEVIDPSTEDACAVISLGGAADTDSAVAAAKAAFPSWSATTLDERLDLLRSIKDTYRSRSDDLAEAISMEMGAPIDLARSAQVGTGGWHISNFIKALAAFTFDEPAGPPAKGTWLLREPVGVCALITPWNWPMNQITLKVIPALGVGCTSILKPSEIAPLSATVFAEILDEAGVPAGVFNLVHGDGPGVGTQLTGHPDVDMVSFTGSTRAGVAISKNAADSVKRVHLELGGKGANLVFADADEKAVVRGTRGCFNNTGQSCNAPTRMLVESTIYDDAVEVAEEVAGKTAVDIASNEGRHIGPQVSAQQWDRVQSYIQTGIDEGARLVAGGLGRPEGHERGFFTKPTVFADVTPDMTIAKEEIFGPVLSIMRFEDEQQAIQIANDTAYGLTNYVQTQDPERAKRVARALRSGMVEVNGQPLGWSPFGGYGQSGNGREGGVAGIEEFLEIKAVSGWDTED